MTEYEIAAAADRWIEAHEQELIHDLVGAVNIKSVSEPGEGGYAMGTGCKLCADYMLELIRHYGFIAKNDDYYSVSALYPGKTTQELGILGHMDVVPEGTGWSYAPYQAVVKDGFVIGRGSSDNKGPTIMSLYVLRCMRDLDIHLNHTVRLIAGFNEESGMQDVLHYLKGHQPPVYTLICDGGWAMCIGEKGILTADIVLPAAKSNLIALDGGVASNSVPERATATLAGLTQQQLAAIRQRYPALELKQTTEGHTTLVASGKAAHAFTPHLGINAIYLLLDAVCTLQLATGAAAQSFASLHQCFVDDYGTGLDIDCEDDISGKSTCIGGTICLLNGQIIQNINVRYAVTQDSDELVQQLKNRCHKLKVGLEHIDYSKPRYTSPELPVTKLLLDTCHEFLPEHHEPYVMGGGTHARKFPNALPYGPGIMTFKNPFGSPHGTDEAVCIQHLKQAVKVYILALLRLDRHFITHNSNTESLFCVEDK